MNLLGFRIRNYKSIVDTEWRDLSGDGVTALIGENESGKSAILEALLAFDSSELSSEGLRDEGVPSVTCSFKAPGSLWRQLEEEGLQLPPGFEQAVKEDRGRINVCSTWDPGDLERVLTLEQPCLLSLIDDNEDAYASDDEAENDVRAASSAEIAEAIWRWAPKFIWFRDETSVLPNEMNIASILNEDESANGYFGVQNFLKVAGVKNQDLKTLASRGRARQLDAAERWSKTVTADLHEFWSQEIGEDDKVMVECNFVPVEEGSRAPGYLAFLLKDSTGRVSFSQRSQGFRWFLSFYLQLKARSAEQHPVVYLMDEPGSSLHAKAQDNVLGVFGSLPEEVQVVYSTHSPWLVDPQKTSRVLAIQRRRRGERDTQVIDAVGLATASKDTLFPLIEAMGADLRSNSVVQQRDNVLLEEPSASYYWRAFLHLVGDGERKAHFIGDHGGADKVPGLVSMFSAWGLKFIVVLDGDAKGEAVKKTLVEQYLGLEKGVMLLGDCHGIEDVFEQADYLIHVLERPDLKIQGRNSTHAKRTPKAVVAGRFLRKVTKGTVTMEGLQQATQDRIRSLTRELGSMLDGEDAAAEGA